MNDVWNNIKNMNLRPDLTYIPQVIQNQNDSLPRYYLSNNKNEEDLYLMDIFNEKYKKSFNEEIFDFLCFLSTNEEIYNNVLNNFNSDENMKLTQKYDEYINNLYTLIIIESIFEDIELLNNNNLPKCDIPLEEYKPFYSKENNNKKKQFFIDFINYNYTDLIEYATKILENLNKEEKYNEKKHNLIMRCCTKCLDLISNIYIPYFNIKYESSKKPENVKDIENESLKSIIQENQLENNILGISLYENLIFQMLFFIDKYYNKYDNFIENYENEIKGIIPILIEKCYLLSFSLIYTNENVFKSIVNIDNKEEKENLLTKIIKNIFIYENNKKNILYTRLLFLGIFKQSEIKINTSALSYLIDLSFNIFEEFIFGNKKKIEGIYGSYLKNLLIYTFDKEKMNDLLKKRIIRHYKILFNYIGSKTTEGKVNEPILINVIQVYNKFLEQLPSYKNKNENIEICKNDIIEIFKNEISLFDYYIKNLALKEEENIFKKSQQFLGVEKLLNEDKENAIISEENLNKIINSENNNKNIVNGKETLMTIIMPFYLLCLNSDNFYNDEKIKNLITILNDLKEKELKENNFINEKEKSQSSKNNNIKNDRIKKNCKYIGIRNLGTICYLNSVIQQLYMIPQFKYAIMGVDDKKPPIKTQFLNDDNILHQIQKLFTYLSYTSYGEVIPKDLVFSIKDFDGQPININQMQDSNEFYTNFCCKIEESLKNTKYEYLVKNLFIGKICNKNICSSCKNPTLRFEDFKDITLEVNGLNNIYESLDKYILEDNIDDFYCSRCEKKVILKRSSLLASLPNILIIHLNRIIINIEDGNQKKINSRLEFPKELDLKKYCLENNIEEEDNIYKKKDEYYKYNLKGVNIHKGNAEGGHYISIIRVNKDKWYQFDDSKVTEYDINNLEEDCYGGLKRDTKQEKEKSAYLLFYELSKKKPIKILLQENEVEIYKKNNGENIIEYNNNNLEEIEKKYDVSKLKDNYDEKELMDKIFHNTDKNNYFKFILYDDIKK